MNTLMVIFGIAMAVEVVSVYALQKVFKDMSDEEYNRVLKALQEIQYKRYW